MKIDVSIGEVIDKATILHIKLEKIKDEAKRRNIQHEYGLISGCMEEVSMSTESEDFKSLLEVNQTLWEIEDKIRIKEKEKQFDAEFIELARSVYLNNDKRADLKKKINLKFGSDLVEEKQYADYS
ncbi:MAG: hypothetical protein FP816_18020 [Desulfobacteraceae bacterium]|nr:hypothetical protein [Desulfobacteraceae bacterium]MBU4001875.1 hypothetical protein [Pseudomonadota bacterium]MBU4055868.1 hypothetical protein [Pseudomonadota bacterium]